MSNKSIESIIDTDYREFSIYVIENRAIPSAIDGLKPSQRKILYVALKTALNKKQKVAAIAANMASMANYNHGENSAQMACVGMAATYNNNLPLLEEHGSFGSRLIQESAAPRYIYSKVSENYEKYFADTEVCPQNNDEDNPEPGHYLPIIPWVLVNGIKGIAIAFATEILPRDPAELVKVMRLKARGKNSNKLLVPKFPEFRGEVISTGPLKWESRGIVNKIAPLSFEISEVPYGYDREKYIAILDKLEANGDIEDYDDACDESGFKFIVKVNRAQRGVLEQDPHNYLKLTSSHSENLTVLGSDGKLLNFTTVDDLIDYFYNYRIKMCSKFIDYKIADLALTLEEKECKIKWLRDVESGRYDIFKKSRLDMQAYISTNITDKEFGKAFANIPMYQMSKDMINALEDQVKQIKLDKAQWENYTAEEYYLTLLNKV